MNPVLLIEDDDSVVGWLGKVDPAKLSLAVNPPIPFTALTMMV